MIDVDMQPATQFGWTRRSDMGRGVWETPEGRLYKHFNDGVPAVFVCASLGHASILSADEEVAFDLAAAG